VQNVLNLTLMVTEIFCKLMTNAESALALGGKNSSSSSSQPLSRWWLK